MRDSRRFEIRKTHSFYIVSGVLLLAGMLAYPMGYDQAVFTVGGNMVLHNGAVPYRDILDTKPPFIFYLYAISSAAFGDHLWAIRAFDVIYWCATLYVLLRLFRKFLPAQTAWLATWLVALQYVCSGFWMTAQAESFAVLPAIGIASVTLQAKDRELASGAAVGVLALIVFLFKFTLLAIAPAVVIYILFQSKEDLRRMRFLGAACAAFAAGIAIYAAYLTATGSLTRFVEAMQWVSRYAAIDPLFGRQTIAEKYYLLFPARLLSSYTPTLLLLGSVALGRFLTSVVPSRPQGVEPRSRLLHLLLWVLAMELLGVLVERKFFPYHYVRAFWAFAPFAAIGLERAWSITMAFWRDATRPRLLRRVAVIVLTATALFFSPLPQVISQPVQWTIARFGTHDVARRVMERIPDYYLPEQEQVASYLVPRLRTSDQIFFWGNDVEIYALLHRLPTTPCLTATPLRTTWTPNSWRAQVLQELHAHPTTYFISEFNDAKEYITGSTADSYQALEQWPELHYFLLTGYVRDTTIGHFLIFRRKP